ncbi:MAG: hypothetical protein IPM13_12770 [Phycisphaerales bacterium]|nr:hypothetical protein [Phycisphaerales bacterium]
MHGYHADMAQPGSTQVPDVAPPRATMAEPVRAPMVVGLGGVLALIVIAAGALEIDAPWLPGEESTRLVNNPDVNPAADPALPPRGLGTRVVNTLRGWGPPLPMVLYAVEWAATGGRPVVARCVDVALHLLCAWLAWGLVFTLLERHGAGAAPRLSAVVAWAAAAAWSAAPVLAPTYAANVGRPELLAAAFVLGAAYLWYAGAAGNRRATTLAALTCLVIALLCGASAGWLLPAAVILAAVWGWRAVARSPAAWIAACLCLAAAVAGVSLRAGGVAGVDGYADAFGDPVTRTLLAGGVLIRALFLPTHVSFWHPSDPNTGWSHPLVWGSVLGLALSAAHAVWAWRRGQRLPAIGWAWFWGLLLPAASMARPDEAADPAWIYAPSVGLLLVTAAVFQSKLSRRRDADRLRRLVGWGAAAGAVGLLLLTTPLVRTLRCPTLRAMQVAGLHGDDPRPLLMAAAALEFASRTPVPTHELSKFLTPGGEPADRTFADLAGVTYERVASHAEPERYLASARDRAAFHRRVAAGLTRAGKAAIAVAQAEAARALALEDYRTWHVLAKAYEASARLDEADEAFRSAERLLPASALERLLHLADYGHFLAFRLERDAEACPRLYAALRLGRPPAPGAVADRDAAVHRAMLGVARCQIRYGQGGLGFELVRQVLLAEPQSTTAWMVAAEYHLRSEHYEQAAAAYGEIVRTHPTNYPALRGLHEVALQRDRLGDAVEVWKQAQYADYTRIDFHAYLVWAEALAGHRSAESERKLLFSRDPDNPFGCLAAMIVSLRAGDLAGAVEWVERAARRPPDPEARELERAARTVRLLMRRGNLPAFAVVAEAEIYARGPFGGAARREALEALDAWLVESGVDPAKRAVAEAVRGRLSDAIVAE